jgi:hypothetical protein
LAADARKTQEEIARIVADSQLTFFQKLTHGRWQVRKWAY